MFLILANTMKANSETRLCALNNLSRFLFNHTLFGFQTREERQINDISESVHRIDIVLHIVFDRGDQN